MADADTVVTLDALHEAIRDQVAAQFPDFLTVEFYRDDEGQSMPTPACLLELVEAEDAADMDAGSGQWHAMLRFQARVVMALRGPEVRLNVRKAALALATYLRLRRWDGIAADPCQVIACEPDEFAPNVERFAVWRVEWVQLVMLGESAWTNDGTVPTQVLYSFTPEVGTPNEGSYLPANGGSP